MAFFTGPWELEPGGTGHLTAFEAVGDDGLGHGSMAPVVTGSVLVRLVWRQTHLRSAAVASGRSGDVAALALVDETLFTDGGRRHRPRRIDPDRDGLYHLGKLGWDFEPIHPVRALHVLTTDPEPWLDHLGERLVRHVEQGDLSYRWARRVRNGVLRQALAESAEPVRRRPPPAGPDNTPGVSR